MIIGKAISPFALRKKNGGAANDPDAQLFITATGITGTNATATNQLVIDLKAANIWTKMKAVYPMVGGTATTCKFNLKDARDLNAAYRLTFSGGGTFSSNGYLPNGINAFANTNLTPSVNAPSSQNNVHISLYSRTNQQVDSWEIGASALLFSQAQYLAMYLRTSTNLFYPLANIPQSGVAGANVANTDSRGLFIANRTASNSLKGFKNNVKLLDNSSASQALINIPLFIGAINNGGTASGYSTKQLAFSSIGDGLTDAEALALYNAVQTFNTTLGRQV